MNSNKHTKKIVINKNSYIRCRRNTGFWGEYEEIGDHLFSQQIYHLGEKGEIHIDVLSHRGGP